jgi:arsenate reductase-like glutaredoxin family protein
MVPADAALRALGFAAMPAPDRVQIFGFESDQATRAAVRFFRERRVDVHLVDLRKKPIAPAELRRFVERLGARALLDAESRAYRDAGIGYLRMEETEIVARLLADQRLLRLPLVRSGQAVSAGPAATTWKAWLKAGPAGPPR